MFNYIIEMSDKLEETIDDIKTSVLNNPETYVLTHNRFNTYLVLISSDLNKMQIYKMLYRDSSHGENEIIMSFNCLYLFKPNGHKEDYHNRKSSDEKFLLEIEDKKYVYVGDKVHSFETNDTIITFSSELGFNDIKFPYAYGEENIYFMLHQNYILILEYETSLLKTSRSIYIKKKMS